MNDQGKSAITIVFVLFGIYLLALLKFIILKDTYYFFFLHFTKYYSWELLSDKFNTMNLRPFKTISYYLRGEDTTGTIPNLIGNILLFLPFGFFLPYLFKSFNRATLFVLFMIAVSLFMEITQLLTAYGTFDIDDCILNVAGALIGFFIYKNWVPAFSPKTEKL